MNHTTNHTEAIELLKNIIAIPSISREEGKVADFLESYLTNKGCRVYRIMNNIYCIGKNEMPGKPYILLDAHIDTVRPTSAWSRNPHDATIEEGKLYGLGSNDDGASLVSLLYAFLYLQETEQQYNLIFSASAEEEVSGKNGLGLALQQMPTISLAICGEPTGMNAAIAEKGLMVLDCIAKGKAGHAARNEGVNAIYEALKDIEWFKNYEFPKHTDLLGKVKMTVTIIQAGTQHNVVPDTCTYTVDIRSNECYSNRELFGIIQDQVKSEINARSFHLNSSSIAIDHPFTQRILAKGKTAYGSPTMSNQVYLSCPSIKIGPGDSSRSHTANEYIYINEIEEAIELYIQLLNGFVLTC